MNLNLPRYSDVPPDPNRGNVRVVDRFMALFNSDNPSLTIGSVISRLLLFAIIAAGLYFFVRLIFAGYKYLTSLGEPAKIQSASKELTNATIGLLVVISAFFLAQIIQVVFGISIL